MDDFSLSDLTSLLKPQYVVIALLVYIAFLKPVPPCVCNGSGSK